jgi:hypothetical protein
MASALDERYRVLLSLFNSLSEDAISLFLIIPNYY